MPSCEQPTERARAAPPLGRGGSRPCDQCLFLALLCRAVAGREAVLLAQSRGAGDGQTRGAPWRWRGRDWLVWGAHEGRTGQRTVPPKRCGGLRMEARWGPGSARVDTLSVRCLPGDGLRQRPGRKQLAPAERRRGLWLARPVASPCLCPHAHRAGGEPSPSSRACMPRTVCARRWAVRPFSQGRSF